MKKVDLATLKTMQVDILKEIDTYCHTKSIQYSLAYGTLIGAVRHRGYIPWDDDIDVIMMRNDYDKFLKEFNSQNERYAVISTENCPTYYAPYANVYMKNTKLEEDQEHGAEIGIKVDIFPIDHLPDTKLFRKLIFAVSTFLGYLIGFRNEKNMRGKSLSHKICAKLYRFFCGNMNVSALLAKYARWADKKYGSSKTINNIVWSPSGEKGSFSISDFENTIKLEFEGQQFDALKGYDSFLKKNYGNYMELPPVEKRVTKHSFKAWIIE